MKIFKIMCLSFIMIMVGGWNTVVLSQNKAASADEKREAEKAWEALIKAKGGREKLHSITNMLTEWSTITNLDIFPDGRWAYGLFLDGTATVNRWQIDKPTGENAGIKGITEFVSKVVEMKFRIPVFDLRFANF